MVFVGLAIVCLILLEIFYRIRLRLQARQLITEIEMALVDDDN